MFGILPRLGKIGVRVFQHWVLIAMPKLFLHAGISWILVILSLCGTLRGVLIARAICHF